MTLLVTAEGGTWLADVGFGAEGLLLPCHSARFRYEPFSSS
jgi:arylamine N-acetyltransferase